VSFWGIPELLPMKRLSVSEPPETEVNEDSAYLFSHILTHTTSARGEDESDLCVWFSIREYISEGI
jgi:hypothetical protein